MRIYFLKLIGVTFFFFHATLLLAEPTIEWERTVGISNHLGETDAVSEIQNDCVGDLVGFTALGELGDSKYYISNDPLKPIEAQQIADQNGGYLAVINSEGENSFIQQNISEMVYIGLNDASSEGDLNWVNDEAIDFFNVFPCSFCEANSDDLDYVIMAPWDGTWSFSSQWNSRKYIVEIPCDNSGGDEGLEITYNCPTDYPSKGSWTIPITVTNNSNSVQVGQTVYLYRFTKPISGYSTNLYGQVDVPNLNPGESVNLDLIADMPDVLSYHSGFSYGASLSFTTIVGFYLSTEVIDIFFQSYDINSPDLVEIDLFCKKYDTDLAIEMVDETPFYLSDFSVEYTVKITNNGPAAAHNIFSRISSNPIPPGAPSGFWISFSNQNTGVIGFSGSILWFLEELGIGESKMVTVTRFLSPFDPTGSQVPDELTLTVGSLGSYHLGQDLDLSNNEDSFTFMRDPSPSDCPTSLSSFTTIGEFNGSKYFMFNEKLKPEFAQDLAAQVGGHLVSINDQAENDFLQQNISDIAYIGLNDVDSEGNFVWDNGDAFTYDNINPCGFCEENSDELDYLIIAPWDGTWSFSSQFNSRKFIVEIPCENTGGGGEPDLTVSNVSASSTSAGVGDQVVINFDIVNIGNGTAAGDFVTAVYLSEDLPFNAGDIYLTEVTDADLGVGASSNVELSFAIPNVPDGDYNIIIIADVNGDIQESMVLNNGNHIPFTIGGSTGGGCSDQVPGFTLLGEFNSSKYFISNTTSRPDDAQMTASQNGGYLVAINNQAENSFIEQNISEMVYIGLNDVQAEETTAWVNGDAVNYENFDLCSFCNSNASNLDFVVIHPWNGGWSWSSQWNQRKYIMEIPCTNPILTPPIPNTLITFPLEKNENVMLKKIMPNPANNFIYASIFSSHPVGGKKEIEIQIMDARGVLVKAEQVELQDGYNTIDVSIQDLPEGFYYLNIPQGQGKNTVKRFVKVQD